MVVNDQIVPLDKILDEKPRIFRLEKEQAIINRLGFNNLGSEVFLKKAIESQDAMNIFLEKDLIDIKYTAITKAIYRLKKTKFNRLFSISHPYTKKIFIANLLSKKPSLFIFDLYKLSYLCYISKNE